MFQTLAKQRNEDNYIMRSSIMCTPTPNIILVIKSRRMRWSGHVAHMGEVHTGFSCRNLGERDHLEDLGIDGRIILKWII
jgi:hypothetical protein